jgi:regulatory protein
MRVLAVRRRGRNHCEITVEEGEPLVIALDVAREAGLAEGAELSSRDIGELQLRDRAWRARERALRLLATRQRATAELRRRLLQDGFTAAEIDPLLAALTASGLLADEAFAGAFVRDRLRSRPRAAGRLVQELRARGVDAELAAAVVRRELHDAGVTDDELARRLAGLWLTRRLRTPADADPARLRARIAAYLARRGFSSGLAWRAARDALAPAPESRPR